MDPAPRRIQLELQADKPAYRPGEEVRLTIRARSRGEPLAGAEFAQFVRVAGTRDDPVLRAWLATLAGDPRPDVRREAHAARGRRP